MEHTGWDVGSAIFMVALVLTLLAGVVLPMWTAYRAYQSLRTRGVHTLGALVGAASIGLIAYFAVGAVGNVVMDMAGRLLLDS